jgi:hypothetical protein
MTRDELEAALRRLRAHRRPDPGDAAMQAMADRIWRGVQGPAPRPPRRWPWLVPAAAVAAAAALWFGRRPAASPLAEPPPASLADLDAEQAGRLLGEIDAEMDEDLREFEGAVEQPAWAGETLLELNEAQLRALLDALHQEEKG